LSVRADALHLRRPRIDLSRILHTIFNTQHHETLSPAPSQASTVTVQEFENTYSIARTKLGVIWDNALSYTVEFAKRPDQESYDRSLGATRFASIQLPSLEALALETEAQPESSEVQADKGDTPLAEDKSKLLQDELERAKLAYPYSKLPRVIYQITGFETRICKGKPEELHDRCRQILEDLQKLNKQLDLEHKLDEEHLLILADACSAVGLPHSRDVVKDAKRKVQMWNEDVLRACSKLWAMYRLIIVN